MVPFIDAFCGVSSYVICVLCVCECVCVEGSSCESTKVICGV